MNKKIIFYIAACISSCTFDSSDIFVFNSEKCKRRENYFLNVILDYSAWTRRQTKASSLSLYYSSFQKRKRLEAETTKFLVFCNFKFCTTQLSRVNLDLRKMKLYAENVRKGSCPGFSADSVYCLMELLPWIYWEPFFKNWAKYCWKGHYNST